KNGSSTPPYTTPATACDSIQKCINFANAGDTIFVDKGEYREQIIIQKRIALIGSGQDSCIVRYPEVNETTPGIINIFNEGVVIEAMRVVNNFNQSYAKAIYVKAPCGDTVYIRDCYLSSAGSFIATPNGRVQLTKSFGSSPNLSTLGLDCASLKLVGNIFNLWESWATFYLSMTMINNVFNLKEQAGGGGPLSGGPHLVANNIIINPNNPINIHNMFYGIMGWKITFYNNFISGKFTRAGIALSLENHLYNNLILYADAAIKPDPQQPSVIKYNAAWKVNKLFDGVQGDSTNKILFPMFVDEEAGDFRLQKYSPLIDAGDPDILDVDGTRSDIGPLGGPYGRSYEYLDLAPRAPFIALPVMTADSLTLRWQKNYETDLTGYRLYQDTVEQFVPFPDKLIYAGQDTSFTIPVPDSGRNHYYFVTAIDSIVNESKPSQPIKLLLTSTKENGNEVTTPEKTQLVGNYPNPFNPSTTIRYTIAERSYVKLYIYTLRGELLEIRVNEEQSAGEYNYLFSPEITGTIDDLASGVYFYMLETKGRETGKIIRETGKMLLMK
ncbi:MAG: T9SS type A sorting domain-containing protein, partial [Ignavibacteriaceae bacterium]|nr:T9SS type A sorting domain-containing protein [Ignavibacteriaceae bacterium]